MRFRAHDTFFIRKGWLSKGLKNVKAMPDVFVNKEINPMDSLGIGANMVKALRYWLQVTGLTKEPPSGKKNQELTDFGKIVFENDRYIEEIGTLCFIHYHLSRNLNEATAWYYFFNEFNLSEFTREDFVLSIQNYVLMSEESSEVAIRSLNDDFSCIINTYLPRYKSNPGKDSPENNIDCPLGELGLVDVMSKEKKTYKKTGLNVNQLNPWVVLAVINDQANGRTELPLNELLNAKNSIGKVFNLDAISLLAVLHNAEKTGDIKIIRTAGLDVVRVINSRSYLECVNNYYESIKK